jgi:hypothetical protein
VRLNLSLWHSTYVRSPQTASKPHGRGRLKTICTGASDIRWRAAYAPPIQNAEHHKQHPDASKGRCTLAHDILTTEPSRLKFLASLLSLSAHKVPLSLLLRQLPSRTVSNPLYFFSCCAALAVSFCRSSIDLFASLWSPRSALTALSLSLARPSCHCPLPSFCSFSCCCFSFSASSGRASLSARAKRTLVMRTVV